MERMYMIEVLVLKVTFAELPVPLKKDVVIQATCGSVVSLEMHTDIMGATANLETKERSSKKKDMDIDCGRSVVFPITVSDMVKLLTNCPMEVSVYSKRQDQPLGTVMIPWHSDFLELVNASQQSGGYITPVAIEQEFEMTKEQTKYGGLINIFIRLTALGRTIYTNIQRTVNKDSTGAPDALGATYLFKSSDNATVFKCQRYGSGSDSDLVNAAPLYNMANRSEGGAGGAFTGGGVPVVSGKRARGTTKSTETLLTMQSGMLSSMSMTPSVFMIMGPQDRVALRNRMLSADSIQSMMSVGNLKGKRYMDLTELHNDVSMFSTFANAFGMSMFVFDDDDQEGEDGDMALNFEPVFIDYKALTKSEIEKRLCKHPDCPAARLFKDYGIGPLAKNFRGTGGMYNDVDPPLTYGMSHCNGTIEGYGPLGKFRKPRNPEDPFTPLKGCKCKDKVMINMKEAPYSSGTSSSSSRCSSTSSCTSSKKSACYTHCPMAAHKITKLPQSSVGNTEPLRLRGGGPIECDPNPPSTCPPDPNLLCQDLMNEFNKVLQEYKDALGPCGQATCAFALNITREECQRVCKAKFDTVNTETCELADSEVVLVEKEEFAGCGVPSCPYKRAAISPAEKDFSKYKGVPGCGNTDCPFIKAKLGMEPEEDKHLPAFKDYQTQKTYKYDGKLPPIHWDCPDPLPKGDCKNPDCPFVKRDALIKKYFPEPCCPCGNPACPYVCAPCTFPGCPFTMADPCPPVCPYTEPPPKELKCTPSICPLVRLTETECKNPCCPYRQYEEKVEECARRMRLAAEMEEEEAEGENSVCTPCGRIRKQSKLRLKSNSRSRTKTSTSRMRTLDTCASTFEDNAEGISCEEECVLSAPACLRTEESKHACDFSKGSEGSSKKGSSNFKTCSKDKNSKNSSDSSSSKQEANKTVSIKEVFDSKTKPLNDSISEKTDEGKLSVKNVSYEKKFKLTLEEEISKMCRKRKFRFDSKSFKPCNKIGHRNCVLPMFNVPKNMGWLWNIHNDYCGLRPRRGWKPGAVSKLLALRMDYFNSIRENRPITIGVMSKSALPASPPKPTVTIQKKKGVINVTMLPIKDPTEVRKQGDGNPYLECTPLQFRITKNEVEKEKEKRVCFCGDEISDTSSSELDIEFSPPGGLVNPRLINHAQPVEMEVQYNINDIPIPEPPPPKKGKNKKGGASSKGKKSKKGK